MKPIKGNLKTAELGTNHNCYVVGYDNATIGVAKDNTAIAIRGVKHSSHLKADEFREDAEPTEETRITILLEGSWEQHFWIKDDKSDLIQFKLDKAGDFLIWSKDYCHTWKPLANSTMLTVSLYEPRILINLNY